MHPGAAPPASTFSYWLILLGFLLSANISAQDQIEVYDQPGTFTFTVPDNVNQITVEAWGAGGKGGDTDGNNKAAGGGGAGGYARGVIAVAPGESFNIQVGAGGSGSPVDGGDSVFGASLIRAIGGSGVLENDPDGGNGGNGSVDLSRVSPEQVQTGNPGASGTEGRNGSGGDGGDAIDGFGATGGAGGVGGADSNGASGQSPGAGGGGGHNAPGGGQNNNTPRAGGSGGHGQILITYSETLIIPASLVAEWRMDESEWDGTPGEILDSSGNGNNATAQTAGTDDSLPSPISGKVCNAGRFRGQGFNINEPPFYVNAQHYAVVPHLPDLSPLASVGGMSIGGWFRLNTVGGRLLHKGEGGSSQEYRVSAGSGRLQFTLWDRWGGPSTVNVSNQSLSADTWYFFAITAQRLSENGEVRVQGYLYDENGPLGTVSEQVISVDYTNKVFDSRLFLAAESFGGNPTNFLDGSLDEIRIYGGILQNDEIADFWGTTRDCPSTDDLIAEYRLEACEWTGAPGEINDSSGNGLNGSIIGDDVISIRNGAINRAARFNESSNESIIEIADPSNQLDDTDQLTITGWINPATYDPINSNALGIFSKRESPGNENAYSMFMGFDGQGCSRNKLCIDVNGTSDRFSSNGTIPLNQWTHFALVHDAGEARLYLNGVLDQTRSGLSSSIRASSAPLRLGDLPQGNIRKPFQGDLDEFKFFGGALSEQRVAEIYSNELAGLDWEGNSRTPVQCGLIFEARMEQDSWDGTPGEVLDTSGSDFHATAIADATTAVAAPAIPGSPGTCRYGEFDGRGDGIVQADAATYLEGLSAITVMAWVYNEAQLNGNDNGIFFTANTRVRDNRLGMRYDVRGASGGGSNGIKASISTSECDSNRECHAVETVSDVMVQGEWQHVAMTWQSGTGIKIFINGIEVGLRAQLAPDTGGTIDNIDTLDIGYGAKADRWEGRIDEFKIFDGALSADRIVEQMNDVIPCDLGYEHIRLIHPATALTCSPAEVTVQACADENCADLYQGPATVDFVSPAATWIPDPVSFDGSTQVSLQYTTAEAGVVLNAEAAEPAASSPTRCFTGAIETNCTMEFLDSGFVLNVPDHIAADQVTGSIAAVKADPADPQQCVPGFDEETKDIGFWSTYLNPASGALAIGIGGNPISEASPGTPISIDFDANGVGDFNLTYPDVGQMRLSARYEGSGDEAGLIMLGETSFIARPSHFALDIADNPAASGPADNVFLAAGIDFPVEVSARNLDDGVTPNFGREATPETVSLSHSLIDPVGGQEGSLSGSFDAFGTNCNDNSAPGTACGDFNWSEVGIISLMPRLTSGSYLGSGDVVGNESGNVGRFVPHQFVLSDGELIDRAELAGCSSDFTYIGERFDARFRLTAQAFGGSTTMNYEGGYAFLDSGELNIAGDPAPGVTAPDIAWIMGSGSATAQLALARTVPEGPLRDYAVTTAPVDDDGVALQAAPEDIGTTNLFFGRMIVDNAIGSELGPLELPWRVEYWENGTWWTHTSDNCTTVSLGGQITLRNDSGTTVAGTEDIPVSAGGGVTSIDPGNSETELFGGTGHFHFTAPLSPGWVDLQLDLDPDWLFLQPDLDDDGDFDNDPAARASFGLFEGSPNRIFLREVMPR